MSTMARHLVTAEEFARLPDPGDGSQLELVCGEIIALAPPGGMHGVSCLKAGRRIGNFVEERDLGTVASNTGFISERDPDTVRGPDMSFWTKERLREIPVGYVNVPPDLIVEVLSPSNTSQHIRAKLAEYFAIGVRLVWVIAPEDRTLTAYRHPDEGRILHESATVAGEDVLPGFACRVSDMLP